MGLNLEQEALASYGYFTELTGPEPGYTCFDVFRTDPAEAAHDWPDFLDVPARSAETCVLLRHMTGVPVPAEPDFYARILSFQEADGLFWRPETPLTRHAVYEEETLVAAALVARAVADGDADAEARLARLVAARRAAGPFAGPFGGMDLRPFVAAHEKLGLPGALELAREFRRLSVDEQPLFRADGSFAGHVHSHLYAAAGLCELGRVTGEAELVDLAARVFRAIRARSTAFGFVPELCERQDDVIGCETCCLMDFCHLAVSLIRAGHTEFADDLERAVRNHLIESRVRHGDWLPERADAVDEGYLVRRDLRRKVVGAYAGWSAPNAILAYDEHLPAAWIKSPDLAPIFLGKVRALQNCCSPSGPKALYLAWQNGATIAGDRLTVHLLLDRALPEAEIRSHEPHEGRVTIQLRAPLSVALREPSFAAGATHLALGSTRLEPRRESGYWVTERLPAGSELELTYALPERTETVTIGNEGHQQYRFQVRWRGSTVMALEPHDDNPRWGRSHLMAEPVALHYHAGGPHPLYQRQHLLAEPPRMESLHVTRGPAVW